MKKNGALSLLLLLFLFPLSAGVELSPTIHVFPMTPAQYETFSFDKSNYATKSPDVALSDAITYGIELSAVFYFLPLTQHIELGLGGTGGVSFLNYSSKNLPNRLEETLSATFFFAKLGPSLRFNFNEKNSIAFTPMFSFCTTRFDDYTSGESEDKVSLSGKGTFLSLILAYKRWFSNKRPVRLGLNMGATLDFPIRDYLRADFSRSAEHSADDYIRYKSDYGISAKVFFGICMNFGNRSIDKKHAVLGESS